MLGSAGRASTAHTHIDAVALNHAHSLAHALTRATNRAAAIAVAIGDPSEVDQGHPVTPPDPVASTHAEDEATSTRPSTGPARQATNLIRTAARVLPSEHRDRYSEEFQSELHDLADAGASTWTQILYALRQLDRAWQLRAELHIPARRSAAP